MKTFLFLDDMRGPWGPEWHHVKTYEECIEALQTGTVEHLSLDHDLQEMHYGGKLGEERTGYHVILWMAENNVWPKKTLIIHTMNPAGRERMLKTAARYAPRDVAVDAQMPTKDMDGYTAYQDVLRLTGRLPKE